MATNLLPRPIEDKQPPAPVQPVIDGFSRPIEKWVQAAAARPQTIIPPRSCKQYVSLSCQFGNALVTVATRETMQPYLRLPNAGVWEWILGPEECLVAITTVDTYVTGIARDVA